jgi:uncharacterized lipoprotein YddW (UPF0748 family)
MIQQSAAAATSLLVGVIFSSVTVAAPPEVRGTWVTTTGLTNPDSTVFSPATTTARFRQLHDIGLNSVYMDVWRDGYTYYHSPTLQQTIGAGIYPGLGSRDLLAETLIQSHRNGMAQIGWWQYGFAAKFGNPTTSNTELAGYMRNRGWLLQDASGAFTNSSNSFAWMNPIVPQVRTFLKSIVLDAVRNYDLDGIQFDDRLAWPVQFGYDNVTRDAYLAETGRPLPANYTDAHFKAWRASKITSFAQELIAELKAVRPNLIISVAPSVYPFSYDSYCVDWPAWKNLDMFDEFVPQVYRNTYQSFNDSWDGVGSSTTGGQVQFMTGRREDFAAGISINTSSGTPNPWTEIAPSIDLVRATSGVAGHVLWYSQGVLNTYAAQAAAYYNVGGNGPALRPDLPSDWRPAPVVATEIAPDSWQLQVPGTGRYQIIARSSDVWSIYQSTVLPGGTFTLDLLADSLELLVDRRGYIAGDANLDGRVDLDDFNTLASNFGQAVNGWALGDFTLNGTVDLDDFNILASHFGLGAGADGVVDAGDWAALAAVVPEPGSFSIAVAVCAAALRRQRHSIRLDRGDQLAARRHG